MLILSAHDTKKTTTTKKNPPKKNPCLKKQIQTSHVQCWTKATELIPNILIVAMAIENKISSYCMETVAIATLLANFTVVYSFVIFKAIIPISVNS